ncbi:MAG: RNA polymerase sporulation sigma factor SigK [Bacillota bacterium]
MLSLLTGLLEGIMLLVSYIRNGRVFPKPLNSEQEQEYLRLMKNGDKNARNQLIEHNLRLVAHIVKKYNNCRTDNEDLISIGTIGLIKGINTYDSSKNTRLATYAARCVENEILMHLRSTRKLSQEVLLQEAIGSDKEGNQISLIDVLGSDEDDVVDQVEHRLNRERLYKKLQCLPPREQRVLELRYGLGKGRQLTQRRVAAILGISRSYVSRIEKKAIEDLSRCFREQD